MHTKEALRQAQQRWGKHGAVKIEPKGGRVGQHGEFVSAREVHVSVAGRPENPKAGYYRCSQCTVMNERDGEGNVVDRFVWHRAGGVQAAYVVGTVMLGMFFEVKAEGDTFDAAFAAADAKRGKAVA